MSTFGWVAMAFAMGLVLGIGSAVVIGWVLLKKGPYR